MNSKNLNRLIDGAMAVEAQQAKEANALGYMARVLVQATMPHKQIEGDVFTRKNGAFSLAMIAHPGVGLPYGTYPRLLLVWLTTEAVRTKNHVLLLGPTLGGFMSQLGLIPTGGRWGTIHPLRDRMKRLFSCSISCTYEDESQQATAGFRIAREARALVGPQEPRAGCLVEFHRHPEPGLFQRGHRATSPYRHARPPGPQTLAHGPGHLLLAHPPLQLPEQEDRNTLAGTADSVWIKLP